MKANQIEILKPEALSAADRGLWRQWQGENPVLYSPYFALGYLMAVNALVDDVYVMAISHNGARIGFLPFQAKVRSDGKIGFARPIGSPMTDYQGCVCASGTNFDLSAVLAQAGFGAFHFTHAVSQGLFEPYARSALECTVMRIGSSPEDWRADRDASYRRHLKNNRKRRRKAEELGPVRTEFGCQDAAVFDQLIDWKKQKFALTGKYDVLGAGWTLALVQSLWRNEAKRDVWADMHALYFGDQLAAIDLGLTNGTTFHSWMVAYNADFHALAPGIQLLELLIDAAPQLGYERLDLGEGVEGYKRHYASEPVSVASGFIAASGPAATLSKLYGACESFGEDRLGSLGKLPGKARRRYTQIRGCEPKFTGRAKAMLGAVATPHSTPE